MNTEDLVFSGCHLSPNSFIDPVHSRENLSMIFFFFGRNSQTYTTVYLKISTKKKKTRIAKSILEKKD